MVYGVEVSIEQEGENYIASIEGRIDATTTPILEKRLKSLLEKAQFLAIDFTEVDYLSSAGMRLLLSMTKKIDGKGGKLSLFGLSDDVMEIIQMAGFDRVLKIFSTKSAALKSLS